MLSQDGILELAIDDMEFRNIHLVLDYCMGSENHIANIAVEHNAKGIPQVHISATHEYFLMYAKNIEKARTNDFTLDGEELDAKYPLNDELGAYRELPLTRTGSEPLREDRPFMFFPFLYKNNQLSIVPDEERKGLYNSALGTFNDKYLEELKHKYISQGYEFILPQNSKGSYYRWKWGVESCKEGIKNNELVYKNNSIYNKNRVNNKIKPKSLWSDTRYDATSKGTRILSNLFGNKVFDYPKSLYLVSDAITIGANKQDLILDYFGGSGTTAHAVINLNREDKGNRQYILVEQGEYFDTVLKPRVQKVIYSKAWKEGKPVVEDKAENPQGVPQIVKVLKLESYEDTLNNLELRRSGLFDHLPENAQQDYLLNYMLNLESRGSLLNVSHFEKPFDYGLNISTTSAGAYEWQKVDLVETFNYLIGAKVIHVDDKRAEQGFVAIECRLPNQSEDEKTLIFWRDCERVDYDGLQTQFDRLGINPADSEYSQVYVNGDHTLETVWDGEQSGSLKIISIEDAFLSLMFEGDA